MNRQQRRKFVKDAKKRGVDKSVSELYLRIMQGAEATKTFAEGDRVKLNTTAIRSHSDYARMTDKYHEFVDSHEDDVFTVYFDPRYADTKSVVCLKEDPDGWFFWTGDLIKVDE